LLGTTIARLIGDATEVHMDSSSLECLELVKSWFSTCKQRHDECKEEHFSQLPTRVLDVSEDQVRLYETRGEREPYLTLSHFWGKAQIITTTSVSKN
jgi:hypothetical protein